ncbi:mitochondrial mRNA pseudouridine synthase Trub2-like [Ctenocephalides felis]|uniref:mitochondrial mRNA pseudouridine synthase Trub2-like n=1 Tax=Ctenocephalides felis TaxID=7515 RepID=UPI000E6E3901|nr:mitochondrial mRNA pseudouridine synthase Trub2-like [Ctenocephalides felis]
MAKISVVNTCTKAKNVLSLRTNDAPTIWSSLNGIINVFKPAGISVFRISNTIIANICRDLNDQHVRPPRKIIAIDNKTDCYEVSVRESFADNTLVVGPRYQMQDVKINPAASLGRNTSGLLLLGVNSGCKLANLIYRNKPTRAYQITGKFGEATDNYFSTGKIVEKATYHRIRRSNIDSLLASMQASHQKKMFEQCGVDLESQAAYELAIKGPIRPAEYKLPVVYGLKCIDFSPPYFTIEVQCINEYEQYLMTLIHDIGYHLHSVAHCNKIRCIRLGHFRVDDSLLRGYWNLQGFTTSITMSNKILEKHPEMLKQYEPSLG